MVGSIPAQRLPKDEEKSRFSAQKRTTWKWIALAVVAVGLLIWFLATQVATRPFDWQLAGRTFTQCSGRGWRCR